MKFTAPSDIELYLDGKKLDFTWVNTGDIYIYEGCNKTYASENADTTGVSYTIIQEYNKTRTTEDLTTDNKSCFLRMLLKYLQAAERL